MPPLNNLPNIGSDTERMLKQAGIHTAEELRTIGAKEAFIRLRMRDPSVCLNRLYGLQGAVEGIRWHHLSAEVKQELKIFFNEVK